MNHCPSQKFVSVDFRSILIEQITQKELEYLGSSNILTVECKVTTDRKNVWYKYSSLPKTIS